MSAYADTQDILCTLDEQVLTITLNRPDRLNAFTPLMADELVRVIDQASNDPAVRALIVTGAGRAFCAGMELGDGADPSVNVFGLDESLTPTLAELEARLDDPVYMTGVRDTGGRVTLALFECKKPVIAAINGPCVGVGATMPLAMDIRLASDKARFGYVFGKIGVTPDACSTWFLPKVVGLPKALEWTFTGEIFDAQEALRSNLVKAVLPADGLMAEARRLARIFCTSRSPVSTALTRQMMYRNSGEPDPLMAHKIESLGLFYASQAAGKEGVAAFVQKRPAAFTDSSDEMPGYYPWWTPVSR